MITLEPLNVPSLSHLRSPKSQMAQCPSSTGPVEVICDLNVIRYEVGPSRTYGRY